MLSIKDMESDQQDSYIYSNDSGATLGSILGDVLQESRSRIVDSQSKKEEAQE